MKRFSGGLDLISLILAKLGHGVGVNKQNASGLQ